MHPRPEPLLLFFVLACDGGESSTPPPSGGGSDSGLDGSDSGGDDSGGGADSGGSDDGPSDIGASVLILGPASGDPDGIAQVLQHLLDHDGLDEGTQVEALELPDPASTYADEMSLMSAWYQHTDRDTRRASFTGDWDQVVLIEATWVAGLTPEFTFEGLHALGGHFEDQGSTVHLLLEPYRDVNGYDFETAVENSYRVAVGTGSGLVPAGLSDRDVDDTDDWALTAATTLYSSLRGVSASRVAEAPDGTDATNFASLADAIHAVVEDAAATEQYSGAYQGPVRIAERELPESYGVMIAGTSSERNYLSTFSTFLDERGIDNHPGPLGQCNDYREVDEDCLETAAALFEANDFVSLFARGYAVDHDDVVAAGGGDIQSQIYDRHWDITESDGLNALDDLDTRMGWVLLEATERDLAMIPHHVFWARFHEEVPDAPMLSDGVHATNDVLYGIATMSFVAATGESAAHTELSEDEALIADIAETALRQWATLQE